MKTFKLKCVRLAVLSQGFTSEPSGNFSEVPKPGPQLQSVVSEAPRMLPPGHMCVEGTPQSSLLFAAGEEALYEVTAGGTLLDRCTGGSSHLSTSCGQEEAYPHAEESSRFLGSVCVMLMLSVPLLTSSLTPKVSQGDKKCKRLTTINASQQPSL